MKFSDGPQFQTQWAKGEGGQTCVYASEWAADSGSDEEDATLQQMISECPACCPSDEADRLSVSACCDMNEEKAPRLNRKTKRMSSKAPGRDA